VVSVVDFAGFQEVVLGHELILYLPVFHGDLFHLSLHVLKELLGGGSLLQGFGGLLVLGDLALGPVGINLFMFCHVVLLYTHVQMERVNSKLHVHAVTELSLLNDLEGQSLLLGLLLTVHQQLHIFFNVELTVQLEECCREDLVLVNFDGVAQHELSQFRLQIIQVLELFRLSEFVKRKEEIFGAQVDGLLDVMPGDGEVLLPEIVGNIVVLGPALHDVGLEGLLAELSELNVVGLVDLKVDSEEDSPHHEEVLPVESTVHFEFPLVLLAESLDLLDGVLGEVGHECKALALVILGEGSAS